MSTIGRPPGPGRPRMSKQPSDHKVHLPGQSSLEKQEVMRVTHITFLPTCSICRNYPARLINGVWLCGGQHD